MITKKNKSVKSVTESDVKKMVKDYLKVLEHCWYYMPVSNGMGVHGIPDFVGVYYGRSFFIETKAPGRRGEANQGLSGLQVKQKQEIEKAYGAYFIVDDKESLQQFIKWTRG